MRVMAVIVGAVVAYASYYAVVQNTCKVDPPITDSAAAIENVKWKIYALEHRSFRRIRIRLR